LKFSIVTLLLFIVQLSISQTSDTTAFKSKNRIWQFTLGVNYALGDFNSTANFNHGHAENGFNIQFGYFGAFKKESNFSLAAGANGSFNFFTINAQSKVGHIPGTYVNIIGIQEHTGGSIYGRWGFVARSGKKKHGLNAFSLDAGPYIFRPGGVFFESLGFFGVSERSGKAFSPASVGVIYGFTTEYLIYLEENFGFYLGIEFKSSLSPLKGTAYRLAYWIPKVGVCF